MEPEEMTNRLTVSSYLDHLPAVFQQNNFLGRFLLAFEQILSRSPSGEDALEEMLARINEQYFDPDQTPVEFLPWLASWVALTLPQGWDEPTRRLFLRQVVPLYRLRGTKAGLEKMVSLYLDANGLNNAGNKVVVYNNLPNFPPHFFQVLISYAVDLQINDGDAAADPAKEKIKMDQIMGVMQQVQLTVEAIINQEKPAYTYYGLAFALKHAMQLLSRDLAIQQKRNQLCLGQNTILGTLIGSFDQQEEENHDC